MSTEAFRLYRVGDKVRRVLDAEEGTVFGKVDLDGRARVQWTSGGAPVPVAVEEIEMVKANSVFPMDRRVP